MLVSALLILEIRSTLGAVAWIIVEFHTAPLAVAARHATALGEDASRAGGGSYSGISKITQIDILLLAVGVVRRLVRVFDFDSLTGDVSNLLRLAVEDAYPCVPSAEMSHRLDTGCLR